jgi:hypothetical protein
MGTSEAFPLIDAIEKNKENLSGNMKAFSDNLNNRLLGIDFSDKASANAGMANVQAGVSGVFQASEITGATSTANSVTNNISNMTLSHMSLVDTANAGGGMGVGLMDPDSGAGAWFRYIHGKDNSDGMETEYLHGASRFQAQ